MKLARFFAQSIRTKIILPYLILTLLVAGVGAFVVTNLVTSSLQERFDNQLLDAGRVVAESIVDQETERLNILRAAAFTEGVPQALADADFDTLSRLVGPIAANGRTDSIILVNSQGQEVYGWQRGRGGSQIQETTGADFAAVPDVQKVLNGEVDERGDKRVFIGEMEAGFQVFTVGPIALKGEIVGAVLVGMDLEEVARRLTESAVARTTLYAPDGRVLASTLANRAREANSALAESDAQYQRVLGLLAENKDQYGVVTRTAGSEVALREVEILGERYQLAFGDWRLRNQSVGMFSVALPSNFIVNTAVTSRNRLSWIFSLSTVGVLMLGFFIAQRIITPLQQLVSVSTAVAQGELEKRTGIKRPDEIGILAHSFDTMTDNLVERNRAFAEQASNLETILNSIADSVFVMNNDNEVVLSNAAARKAIHQLNGTPLLKDEDLTFLQSIPSASTEDAQRFELGNRAYSALAAPIITPEGNHLGRVIALRDITREMEAERVKDDFITNVSHELRTPLTAVKVSLDLLAMTAKANLTEKQADFIAKASTNTDRIINYINQLLEIGEMQGGELSLNLEPANFNVITAEAVEQWANSRNLKDMTLDFEPGPGKLCVKADKVRLGWVISNLLQNAHDYTPEGGRITVRVFAESNHAHITVTDTGIGIQAKDQRYLFTRFFRIQNDPPYDVRGMGLGLFIVKSLVEAHHGRVYAVSEFGKGSTFGFAIPLIEERLPEETGLGYE